MTLVVAIVTDDSMCMISDGMLSVDKDDADADELGNKNIFPTQSDAALIEPRRPVALSQKVVTIRDRLHIGWCGDYDAATKFIEYLRDGLPRRTLISGDIKSAQDDYFREHPEASGKFSTIVCLEVEDGCEITTSGDVQARIAPDFGTILVMGSGTTSFLTHVENERPQSFEAKNGQPRDMALLYFAINYVASTVTKQSLSGEGVGEGWGGWFEVLCRQDGGRLAKLDRMMFATMYWWFQGGKIVTSRYGRRYFEYYDEDELIVLSEAKHEGVRINRMPLPGKISNKSVVTPPDSPQLMCIVLINKETNVPITKILYAESGHPIAGIGSSLQGSGTSIRLSTQGLIDIISDAYDPRKSYA